MHLLLVFLVACVSSFQHGISLRRGRRIDMEDRVAFNSSSLASIYGLFDGHGGHEIADALQRDLLDRVLEQLHGHAEPQEALFEAFGSMEKMVDEMEEANQCGSTAVVAIVTETDMFLANVGNSLALLCSEEGPLLLTAQHELSVNEEELQRVRLQGGSVSDHRGKKRLEGDLELSRSFGDKRYRTKGLISYPEIFHLEDLYRYHGESSSKSFLFLLLLSDGIVESLTYEEVCSQAKAQYLSLSRPALSPPQPPPIVLSSSKVSILNIIQSRLSSLSSSLYDLAIGLLLPLPSTLPYCCDCESRSKCKNRRTSTSAQSVAERVSTQAFNRGSSDNLAVIAVNLVPSYLATNTEAEMVLAGSGGRQAYTLYTRLASLPSVLDPSALHGHQPSLTSTPYYQHGFLELLLLDDDSHIPTSDLLGYQMTDMDAFPCLGFNAGDGAIALRGLEMTCKLVNELVVSSSSQPSSERVRAARGLLSFDGEERLGSGSFGSVWRARGQKKDPGHSFVVKKLDHRKAEALESGEREAYFGRALKRMTPTTGHSHIVEYIEHFYGEARPGQKNGRDLFLVFSDAGKSLHDLMYQPTTSESSQHQWAMMGPSEWWRRQRGKTKDDTVRFLQQILFQILTALDLIHSQSIVHRDIKPENIMVARDSSEYSSDLHLRLIDFGSSLDQQTLEKLYRHGRLSSAQTTLEYAPPEQMFGTGYWEGMGDQKVIHPHAFASDIWSVGITALELILATPNVFELSDGERKSFEKQVKAAGKDPSTNRLLLRLRGLLELCIHPSMRLDLDGSKGGHQVASVRCSDFHFGEKIKKRDPVGWGLSEEGIDLVRRMLHWDSRKRISANEALNHPFFKANI